MSGTLSPAIGIVTRRAETGDVCPVRWRSHRARPAGIALAVQEVMEGENHADRNRGHSRRIDRLCVVHSGHLVASKVEGAGAEHEKQRACERFSGSASAGLVLNKTR